MPGRACHHISTCCTCLHLPLFPASGRVHAAAPAMRTTACWMALFSPRVPPYFLWSISSITATHCLSPLCTLEDARTYPACLYAPHYCLSAPYLLSPPACTTPSHIPTTLSHTHASLTAPPLTAPALHRPALRSHRIFTNTCQHTLSLSRMPPARLFSRHSFPLSCWNTLINISGGWETAPCALHLGGGGQFLWGRRKPPAHLPPACLPAGEAVTGTRRAACLLYCVLRTACCLLPVAARRGRRISTCLPACTTWPHLPREDG